jgi:hypothetical protein
MNPFIEGLANFFNRLNLTSKFISLIVFVTIMFWIDSQMGFSYHYFTQRKIEEIETYNRILKDNSLDSTTRAVISKERMSVITKSRALFEPIDYKAQPPEHSAIFHISYSWLLVLLIIFSPYLIRKGNSPYTPKSSLRNQTVSVIAVLTVGGIVIYFIAKSLSVYVKSGWLFTANTFLQLIFLYIIYYLTNRFNQSKKAVASIEQ